MAGWHRFYRGGLFTVDPFFVKRIHAVRDIFWIPRPHLNSIAITFENFNAGYNATPGIYFLTFMIFSSLFILGIYLRWKEKKRELLLLCSLVFIPVIFTFLAARVMSVYLDRQLMLFSPFYYTVIAAGLLSIKNNVIKGAVAGFAILLIAFCLYNYYTLRMPMPLSHHIGVHLKKPVKPAADYINKGFTKGDIIGNSGPSANSLFYYLWDKIINEKIDVYSFVIKSKLGPYWRQRDGVAFAAGLITQHIIMLEDVAPFKKLESRSFKKLWFISSSWRRDGNIEYHERSVNDELRKHYKLLERREFDGIFVDCYSLN